jgi:thioredoxin 2
MAPELERAASELAGRALVVKINTEAQPDLGGAFSVRSIPTLILFRDGHVVHRTVGAQSASAIVAAALAT